MVQRHLEIEDFYFQRNKSSTVEVMEVAVVGFIVQELDLGCVREIDPSPGVLLYRHERLSEGEMVRNSRR